jgi:(p)ppGpp synthase/HD superfamily hydrolase
MSTLERAIAIAAEAHAGQRDKAGFPYVLHALRVMLNVASEEERIVAALHDVVEDCPAWNFERLRGEGFSPRVIAALESVTKRDREDYEAFVRRAASNPIGRAVKLADLRENCDLSRIADPSERDRERLRK